MSLVGRYLSLHLKSSLEYRSSFILSVISQVLGMFVELFTVISLFRKFGLLEEYNSYELLLGFSTIWLGFSLAEMFGRGFDQFSKVVINGNFDLLLIRPRNIYLLIFGTDMCYEKVGRVTMASIIFMYSAYKVINGLTILKLLLLVFMIIGAVAISISVFIIGASITFVTIEGLEAVNIITNGTRQLGQFPMGIYKRFVRLFFTFVIPLTMVNYYPISYLKGDTNNVLYVLLPLFSMIMLLCSTKLFKISMGKYQSTGS